MTLGTPSYGNYDVYSLLWVVQDLYHQPYHRSSVLLGLGSHHYLAAEFINIKRCYKGSYYPKKFKV